MKLNDNLNKYLKHNINNIQDFSEINFIDNLVKEAQQNIDNMYYEFLTENGYKIDKPYNIKQLQQIKEDLAKQDKFIDYLEYTEFAQNSTQAFHYMIPFFNSISNPLSEENREFIIEEWKKRNKDK